jgi:hypothetical protein
MRIRDVPAGIEQHIVADVGLVRQGDALFG